MAIKIQGSTILDDNRNLLSGNTITAAAFVGPLTGNSSSVTNGVYTTGDQTIGGAKTFTSNTIVSATGFTTFSIVSTNASTPRLELLRTGGSGFRITTNTDPDLRFVRLNSAGAEIDTPLVINNNGNIGVGNTDPQQRLTVAGNISLSGGIVANNSFGAAGQVLTSNGTVSYWSTPTTNLTYSANSTTVTVTSSTGTNAVIPGANSTAAGVITTGAQTIDGSKTLTAPLYLSNVDVGNRVIFFQTSGTSRWAINVSGAETGANTGSNFVINRYTDAGSYVDSVFGINRATGRTTFAGNVRLLGGLEANNSVGSSGQVLTSNGSGTYWSTPTGGGGGGATNLTYSANTSTVTIASDTGTDAVILEANSTTAGVITTLAQTIAGAKTFTGVTTISNNSTGALVLNRSIETAFVGLTFANAGVARWLEYMPNTADGDLVFQARNDDGSALGSALTLRRSTRQVETGLDLVVGRNLTAEAGTITSRRTSVRDGIILSPRNGGTEAFATTITTATLTANNTLTLANGDTTLVPGTMATRGTAIAMAMIFG